jgi:hypothetical protein
LFFFINLKYHNQEQSTRGWVDFKKNLKKKCQASLIILTESLDAEAYWRKLKQRLKTEGSEVVTNCHGLKLEASDGKKYKTDCANTEGIFRIIQSIPSKKAEPFKRWLAKVGG